jgi:hypothetical protein
LADATEFSGNEIPKSRPAIFSALKGESFVATVALLCFSAVVFLGKASESTLPSSDAAARADLAMNVTTHGLSLPFPQNLPVGFFAVSGWVMRALEPDSWSAKLTPGLFSIGCVMLTFLLGRVLRSSSLGILAGIILVLSRDFIHDGLHSHLDGVMLFFVLASFLFWERGKYALAGIAAGLGVWFKSPAALVLYPAALIIHLVRLDFLSKVRPWLISLAIAVGVGSLIWIFTGFYAGWDVVREYWSGYLSGAPDPAQVQQTFDPLLFLEVLRGSYLPWSIFFVVGLVWNIAFFRFRRAEFIVPLSAGVIYIVAISCLRIKYPHNFVPAYPFLALIAAQPLVFWIEKREHLFYRAFAVVTLLGSAFLLATPVQLAPESFPALRKFIPYIQSGGDCRDQVVIVEGGQPHGHFNDFSNLIRFYTGRAVALADCQTVNLAAQKREVKWILIAGKNYSSCLDDSVRRAFSRELVDGDQVLLTRPGMISGGDSGGKLDLTPLNRDLKAVQDCQVSPLMNDRFHSF